MKTASTTRSRGFSLIEMLVAISVVGVLSTITLLAVNKAIDSSKQSAEIAGARQLIAGYLIYPQDHRGALMPAEPAEDELIYMNVQDQYGNPVLNSAAASRYPFRLMPYVGGLGPMYSGRFGDLLEDMEEGLVHDQSLEYMVSLYAGMGLNVDYTGGNYNSTRYHPDKDLFPGLAITRLSQVEDPTRHIVFASSLTSLNEGSSAPYKGCSVVHAPKFFRRSDWGSVNEKLPGNTGYVHLRYEGRAMVAHLDGSIAFLDEAELRDMRRWSNQARRQNNPDFTPTPGSN